MSAKLAIKTFLDPSGIKNKGNTCFFNASIQCFLSLPKIIQYFLETPFDPAKQPFCLAFQNFIFDYKNNKILDPAEFLSKIRTKIRLFDGKQQDAHAFLENLTTKLCDELDSLEKTKTTNIIKGTLAIDSVDNVKCQACGFVCTVKTAPLMQYLFIKKSIQESIDSFIRNEECVDADQPWKCTKCGAKGGCSIKHSIDGTSEYLIFYLNRFQSIVNKNNAQTLIDQSICINNNTYGIIGMACHSGVLSGGHYFSYCKRGKWYELNDSLVQAIDSPESSSSAAYILFYAKM